nr:unnamed protein product [Digitaria exilis]
MRAVAVVVALLAAAATARAQQCGWQAGGKLCPDCLCCSQHGYCGSTDPWWGNGSAVAAEVEVVVEEEEAAAAVAEEAKVVMASRP